MRIPTRRLSRVAAVTLAAVTLTPAVASAAPVRILPLGDSITQGAGGDYTWRYDLWRDLNPSGDPEVLDFVGDRQTLWNAATGKQDGNRSYIDPNFDQGHNAIWARPISDGASAVGPLIRGLAAKPDAILVHLGSNDARAGAAKSASQMRLLIANARAAAPGVAIVIGRLYPFYGNAAKAYQNVAYVRDLNAQFEAIARSLDTPSARVIVAQTDTGFQAATHTWDGRHPTPTGENIIASGFSDALATLGLGDGAPDAQPQAWPLAGPQPTVVSKSADAASISWTASVPGAIGYKLERRDVTSGGAWLTVGTIGFTQTTLNQGGLARTRTYAYRLTPVRGTMVGQAGPESQVVISSPVPGAKKPWWCLFC